MQVSRLRRRKETSEGLCQRKAGRTRTEKRLRLGRRAGPGDTGCGWKRRFRLDERGVVAAIRGRLSVEHIALMRWQPGRREWRRRGRDAEVVQDSGHRVGRSDQGGPGIPSSTTTPSRSGPVTSCMPETCCLGPSSRSSSWTFTPGASSTSASRAIQRTVG